jgi:hypothetical protein
MGADADSIAEYRDTAARCLRFAGEALTIEGRTYWLSQAQFWHDLATHLADGEADGEMRDAMLAAARRRRHDRSAEN